MNKLNSKTLPEADFYLFYDARESEDGGDWLIARQYDSEGVFTGQPSEESSKIYDCRMARMAQIDPTRSKDGVEWLYRDSRYPITPDMVHRNSWFNIRKPVALEHHMLINCLSPKTTCNYIVVSEEWKNVIEHVEPSTHEFFPLRLNFHGGSSVERFIFRHRTVIADFVQPINSGTESRRSDINALCNALGSLEPYIYSTARASDFEVKTNMVVGRCWVELLASVQLFFVSKALAVHLVDLLPDGATLLPMATVNS